MRHNLASTHALRQWKVNAKLVRIETILTGATGENGLVGNAAKLEERVRTLETR